jgi:metallo-beta-lactamase class B
MRFICKLSVNIFLALIVGDLSGPCRAEDADANGPRPQSRVPRWDARGCGPLPWQAVACLDINDDATRIVLGTIAPFGDPNVLVLDGNGKILRQERAGQRWIDQVAMTAENHVWALCTMPAGRAGDLPELFRLSEDACQPERISWRRKNYPETYFHYGDHSNHVTRLLARAGDFAAALDGDQVVWLHPSEGPKPVPYPLTTAAIPVSLALDRNGFAVVGTTDLPANLHLIHRESSKLIWSRPSNTETDLPSRLEKGLYGTPTLPDGKRDELPQRDEKIWAALAVAVCAGEAKDGKTAKPFVAAADYQGWQRWVRSSATGKEENLGIRFMPSRPTVTVYDADGKIVRRFGPECFARPLWCNLQFLPDGTRLFAWPHHWTSRGLAGQPVLPADEGGSTVYMLDVSTGRVSRVEFPDAVSDLCSSDRGALIASCWNGRVYLLSGKDWEALPPGVEVGGPSLVRMSRDGSRIVVAETSGVISLLDGEGKVRWRNDLNKSVPRSPKPWIDGARAMPIAAGVWQLQGGRVESDLGGQRLVEAPGGLILIEAHAGLSFESEWAAIKAVGLDPMQVKYVLATHEHGDHAPGAYLWRVATGARFVCSPEMAYTLQHHIPLNSGYGFHPPVPTDITVSRDTEMDLAGLKVQALRLPGHTFGSMAWRFEKDGKSYVAFGDLIMPKGVLGYSGSINFSATDVLSSLRKLQALRPDMVLPGHGANEEPANTVGAGIDVGVAGGWGLIRPEKPDPYFRIDQKNVIVAAWNIGATSAAFGDIDGDGRPDIAVVVPGPEGTLVKIFLNKGGKFAEKPDHEIRVPQVSQPHKIRVVPGRKGTSAELFIAGRSAALLTAGGTLSDFRVVPLDFADGNQLRVIPGRDKNQTLLGGRFSGFYVLEPGRPSLSRYKPEIAGPYVDVQALDLNGDGRTDLVTSYGQVFLRGSDGTFPEQPSLHLATEKGDWSFLAVGDFNGDGRPDIVLLSYGMHGQPTARVFYNKGNADRPFAENPDAVIPLPAPGKNEPLTLLRDSPPVIDWNGDGIADLIIGRGQSSQVLILLGSREGLDLKRSRSITLDYRVHFETGLYAGDFNGDGRPDLAAFGYTLTGVGWNGPTAAYIWLQPPRN